MKGQLGCAHVGFIHSSVASLINIPQASRNLWDVAPLRGMLCVRPFLARPVTSVPENGRARLGRQRQTKYLWLEDLSKHVYTRLHTRTPTYPRKHMEKLFYQRPAHTKHR